MFPIKMIRTRQQMFIILTPVGEEIEEQPRNDDFRYQQIGSFKDTGDAKSTIPNHTISWILESPTSSTGEEYWSYKHKEEQGD